jgi:Xaa-Pro dipeptidase
VITVEPGIYFCKFIIEPYLRDPTLSKYIDEAVLDKYWEVGGVRIEDNVHVTKDGYENLTNAPKFDLDSTVHGVGRHGMGDV